MTGLLGDDMLGEIEHVLCDSHRDFVEEVVFLRTSYG